MITPRIAKTMILFALLFMTSLSYGMQDTTLTPVVPKRSSIKFTTRMHSMGLFSYGGRIASTNPAFDVNFIYQRKHWGYFFFKATDLYDHKSDNNFMLTTVFTNIKVNNVFTITPHVGFLIEQRHSFADRGSDVGMIVITTAKLSDHLKIDHTAIMSNLLLEPQYCDWTNRVRVMYQHKHLDVTYFSWHNNNVLDDCGHISTGLNISCARIAIGKMAFLSAGITGLVMLRETDMEEGATRNGLVFSIACEMN
jgi:hypothetical protein